MFERCKPSDERCVGGPFCECDLNTKETQVTSSLCPKCGSPNPEKHPTCQIGCDIVIRKCEHPFHTPNPATVLSGVKGAHPLNHLLDPDAFSDEDEAAMLVQSQLQEAVGLLERWKELYGSAKPFDFPLNYGTEVFLARIRAGSDKPYKRDCDCTMHTKCRSCYEEFAKEAELKYSETRGKT